MIIDEWLIFRFACSGFLLALSLRSFMMAFISFCYAVLADGWEKPVAICFLIALVWFGFKLWELAFEVVEKE